MFAIRRYRKPEDNFRLRINENIRASQVRVVYPDGGSDVLTIQQALDKARQYGLDLIEVVADSNPPVCKIFDVGKYKYELEKKMKESKKHQKTASLKEIRIRPSIGEHDYQVKLNHMIDFLQDQNKVKVTIMFKGREVTHTEIGMKMAEKIKEDLKEYAELSSPTKMDGRNITTVFAPIKGKK